MATTRSSTADTTKIAASALARASSRNIAETVFVELGESSQRAQIARDGVQVVAPAIDEAVREQIFVGRPKVVAKVLSQSVKAGTAVPKGTTIDVELAEPGSLPTKIVKNVHLGLAEQTLGSVFDTFLKDAAVRGVVARNTGPETLTAADKAVITNAFSQQDLAINDDPGRTITEAFSTLQAAFTFGI